MRVRVVGDSVFFIYDDAAADFLDRLRRHGECLISRASYVEPFDGGWVADLSPVGGPILGPFRLRREALDAERAWLDDYLKEAKG
ncbi:MAG: hypothetical protein V2G41_09495 [bacterium JZ-2024 1]